MKPLLVTSLVAVTFCGGCVSRATVRDEPRRDVEFASAAAAQTFYDSYLRLSHSPSAHFTVAVPLPYRHLKLGSENVQFNRAVQRADTDRNDVISADEADALAVAARRVRADAAPLTAGAIGGRAGAKPAVASAAR